MPTVDPPPASVGRVFTAFAAISLVVVVAMGLALSRSFSAGSRERGLAEGRAQVELMATASIEPLLSGLPASDDLDVTERTVINWAAAGKLPSLRTIGGHLRFRRDDVMRLLSGAGEFGGV